jgi:hypothetical protein
MSKLLPEPRAQGQRSIPGEERSGREAFWRSAGMIHVSHVEPRRGNTAPFGRGAVISAQAYCGRLRSRYCGRTARRRPETC